MNLGIVILEYARAIREEKEIHWWDNLVIQYIQELCWLAVPRPDQLKQPQIMTLQFADLKSKWQLFWPGSVYTLLCKSLRPPFDLLYQGCNDNHIDLSVSLLRYNQKISTQQLLLFFLQVFWTKWLLKANFSILCDLPLHILNSFWECLEVWIFWYIILGFLQYWFFFRLRLSFISFSVQVIPYCLYNIQVWTLWRPVHDSVFYQLKSYQIWFHWH